MSHEIDPAANLLQHLTEARDEGFKLFEDRLAEPDAQAIVGALCPNNPLFVGAYDRDRSYAPQGVLSGSTESNAYFVATTAIRAYEAYDAICNPTIEDAPTVDMGRAIKILRGGDAKVTAEIEKHYAAEELEYSKDENTAAAHVLALYFVLHDAAVPPDNADASIVPYINAIREGKKQVITPQMPEQLQIAARAANVLRDLYWRGQSQGFQRQLIDQQAFGELVKVDKEHEGETDTVNYLPTLQRVIDDAPSSLEAYGGSIEKARPGLAFGAIPMLKRVADPTYHNKLARQRDDFLFEARQIQVARSFIDMVAEHPSYDVGDTFMTLTEITTRQPLLHDSEVIDDTDVLDWEVLPPAEDTGRTCNRGEAETEEMMDVPAFDMERVARLRQYVAEWGGGLIARSLIPNLPEEKQYYLAVLPQRLEDGTVIEHAIADNPEAGRHAVYAWRGEAGIGRFGQVQRTWREVFRENKPLVRQLGAKPILHTINLDDKIFEYLTRPAANLADKRYRF